MRDTCLIIFEGIIFYFLDLNAQQGKPLVSASENIDSIIETKMEECGIVGIGAAIIVNKRLI
ncbi:hypothetical protein [Niabella beijingensis]|uniref:hypothetical protein n=1 Tax=Niabella beijingensis TaxID=2872700 RepID=UPI001CBE741D|nr:hypothetical protein [Niabella beijingensis]MBZ4189405.1 hypothetical protein [Niabella beijingensis]